MHQNFLLINFVLIVEYLEKESRIHSSMSKSQATINDSYSTPYK